MKHGRSWWLAVALVALAGCDDGDETMADTGAAADAAAAQDGGAVDPDAARAPDAAVEADAGADPDAAIEQDAAAEPDAAPDPDAAPEPDMAPRDPLAEVGEPIEIASGLQFTEGPLWDAENERLLFTDIPVSAIYALAGGGQPEALIQPSGNANGLAWGPDGSLLVCEHAGRVVRYATPDAEPEVLADAFEGQPLHSPNDLVAASDGTVYFTDPPYGRGGRPGPLPFMGVFRVAPDGTITAEHRGALAERPNGIALSPDERWLYVADTAMGTLHRWDVMDDGSLSGRQLIAENLPGADGIAMAPDGTLLVASARGVVVFDPDGNEYGVIAIPRQPSNCTPGPNGSLFVTARDRIYRVGNAVPQVDGP